MEMLAGCQRALLSEMLKISANQGLGTHSTWGPHNLSRVRKCNVSYQMETQITRKENVSNTRSSRKSGSVAAHHGLPRVRHFLVSGRVDAGGSDGHVCAVPGGRRQEQLVHGRVPRLSRGVPARGGPGAGRMTGAIGYCSGGQAGRTACRRFVRDQNVHISTSSCAASAG